MSNRNVSFSAAHPTGVIIFPASARGGLDTGTFGEARSARAVKLGEGRRARHVRRGPVKLGEGRRARHVRRGRSNWARADGPGTFGEGGQIGRPARSERAVKLGEGRRDRHVRRGRSNWGRAAGPGTFGEGGQIGEGRRDRHVRRGRSNWARAAGPGTFGEGGQIGPGPTGPARSERAVKLGRRAAGTGTFVRRGRSNWARRAAGPGTFGEGGQIGGGPPGPARSERAVKLGEGRRARHVRRGRSNWGRGGLGRHVLGQQPACPSRGGKLGERGADGHVGLVVLRGRSNWARAAGLGMFGEGGQTGQGRPGPARSRTAAGMSIEGRQAGRARMSGWTFCEGGQIGRGPTGRARLAREVTKKET